MELKFKGSSYKLSDNTNFYTPCGYLREVYAKFFAKKESDREAALKLQNIMGFLEGEATEINFTKAAIKAKEAGVINDEDMKTITKNIVIYDDIVKDTNDILEVFKASIDLDTIKNDELKELLESDVKEEFWQRQNIVEIEEKVFSFRKTLGIR